MGEKKARLAKEKGNDLYKAKRFNDALAAYDEAIVIDPTCMTFLLNKAAVYFAQKNTTTALSNAIRPSKLGKNIWPHLKNEQKRTLDALKHTKRNAISGKPSKCAKQLSWNPTAKKLNDF